MQTIGQYPYRASMNTKKHLSMIDKWCKWCKEFKTKCPAASDHTTYLAKHEWMPLREALATYAARLHYLGFVTKHNTSTDRRKPIRITIIHPTSGHSLTILLNIEDDKNNPTR